MPPCWKTISCGLLSSCFFTETSLKWERDKNGQLIINIIGGFKIIRIEYTEKM